MNIENNSILNIHLNPEGILRIVLNNPKTSKFLENKKIFKTIYIKDKIVNYIIK